MATETDAAAQERRRRWSWWPARIWTKARYRDVRAALLERVGAAASAYEPVLAVAQRAADTFRALVPGPGQG